jgi:hypothetical protein
MQLNTRFFLFANSFGGRQAGGGIFFCLFGYQLSNEKNPQSAESPVLYSFGKSAHPISEQNHL